MLQQVQYGKVGRSKSEQLNDVPGRGGKASAARLIIYPALTASAINWVLMAQSATRFIGHSEVIRRRLGDHRVCNGYKRADRNEVNCKK